MPNKTPFEEALDYLSTENMFSQGARNLAKKFRQKTGATESVEDSTARIKDSINKQMTAPKPALPVVKKKAPDTATRLLTTPKRPVQ